MVSKQGAAKWSFWLGVLWLIFSLPTGTLAANPVGAILPLSMMAPYIYVQYKKGKTEEPTPPQPAE